MSTLATSKSASISAKEHATGATIEPCMLLAKTRVLLGVAKDGVVPTLIRFTT